MSILIHFENGVCKKAELLYERTTPSATYYCANQKTFCVGEVFDRTFEDVAASGWEENPDILNDYQGAFALAKINEGGCVFAVDMNGIDTFFYYINKQEFLLSDNFWDIVRIIQPEYDDLNVERIKQSLLCPSVSGETVIRGLYILRPSHIGLYDSKKQILKVTKYRKFSYSNEISDVDLAVKNMDRILDNAFSSIKEKCGDVQFGVGISGGLDSRVIPHYAKKHGMRIVGFNICVPKPHKLMLARGCKNARQLIKIFRMPYREVKWNPYTIKNKIMAKTRNYPHGTGGNSFKYESDGMPQFSVLLTGGSGEIVGSELPKGIQFLSETELFEKMKIEFMPDLTLSNTSNKLSRALDYLFGTKVNFRRTRRSVVFNMLGQAEWNEAEKVLSGFIREGKNDGKTNIDIYEDFFLNVCGYANRYGAFESLLGTKRAFSIYIPFMLKETLRWAPGLLEDRLVLNELIRRKIPEVASVRSESFYVSPKERNPSKIKKMITLAEYVLRGNGGAIDQYYMKNAKVWKLFTDDMTNDCIWFKNIFSFSSMPLNLKEEPPRTIVNLWELKSLIDCIEKKDYITF